MILFWAAQLPTCGTQGGGVRTNPGPEMLFGRDGPSVLCAPPFWHR
jgi:hypothetical protein